MNELIKGNKRDISVPDTSEILATVTPVRDVIQGNARAEMFADDLAYETFERSASPRHYSNPELAAEMAIQRRARQHHAAVMVAKRPELDSLRRDVSARLAVLNQRDIEVVSGISARRWAELDAGDFCLIENLSRREHVALGMAAVTSARYKQALQEVAPDVAETIAAYDREHDRRIAKVQLLAMQAGERPAPLHRLVVVRRHDATEAPTKS